MHRGSIVLSASVQDCPQQPDMGLKQVHIKREFFLIEVIHGEESLRRVIPVPTHELPYMGPVFLFNMSIIVLFIGARASKLYLSFLAVIPEMVIDKF